MICSLEQNSNAFRIQELPLAERPRERLLRRGAQCLTDAELLALFIRCGLRGESAIAIGQRLLRDFGGLRLLLRADSAQLQRCRGLGPAKVALMLAAIELGRRAQCEEMTEVPLDEPALVYRFLAPELQALRQEVVLVLLLNQRLRLIQQVEIFRGTVNESPAHPREILAKALAMNAPAFVLAHNHPSGDPSPSDADKRITRRIREAADAMGIEFTDHLIIGCPASDRPLPYFSFRQAGLL